MRKDQIPSPFEPVAHKTERTAVAELMYWMRRIIEKEHLDLGLPDVETSGADRKMPDLVVYESSRSQRVLCVIEAKPPYFNVFDEEELKTPAHTKANHRKSKYFAVTNFKTLVWYNTEAVNQLKPEEEQIIQRYPLSEIENLDDIRQTRFSEPICRQLRDFLVRMQEVSTGRVPEPKLAVDELLVFRLHEKIRILSRYYTEIITNRSHKDEAFRDKLLRWFRDQNWNFAWQRADFEKAARQAAYLIVNKVLFYDALQAKRPHDLDPLQIPEGLTKGAMLEKTLQGYFDEVLKIDYQAVYTTDFIDDMAFPDEKEVVKEIKELVSALGRYNFATLGYDIIGRLFERLIPSNERHNLGQYFTSPDVVDLILRFCSRHEDDKILDPSCGAGTFLVRAYQHKKLMNQQKKHESILETLWGTDIAKFPAHLATINLAINDLSVNDNYPNIIQEDFFEFRVGQDGVEAEEWRKRAAAGLGAHIRIVTCPRWFDAVVGNPPYTRQEEIPEIEGVNKQHLIESALTLGGSRIADISKQAGIHAYFFVHGMKFLKDGGWFGFVVSNSWLDTAYGKGLQEFLLTHYKVVAIIESKVERWFDQADINTCIVILQKCRRAEEREANLVRFAYLKKPLRDFVPPASEMWDRQIGRRDAIDSLRHTILGHNELYENDDLRVFPITQSALRMDGQNDLGKYTGSKWGKYLRAPDAYFKLLRRMQERFVPLEDVANVYFGLKTGANDFFYLTEEEIARKRIEHEFWMHQDENAAWVPNYIIPSPSDCEAIVVDRSAMEKRVLLIDKTKKELKGTHVLKYIREGEEKNLHKRPTCAGRTPWYILGDWQVPDLLWPDAYNERYAVYNPQGILADKRFFFIYVKPDSSADVLHAYLNSSVIPLMVEIEGITNLGQGAIYTNVYQVKRLRVPSFIDDVPGLLLALDALKKRKIGSVYDEYGAREPASVALNTIRPDRRELDRIVMGDILGMTEDEQLEVYRAVLDLVGSRIARAKSVKSRRSGTSIDEDALKEAIVQRIEKEEE